MARQVPINLATNLAVFIAGVFISIFLTPFYIKHIGVEGLGIVRLAFILPMYAGLVSLVISGAVGRFLTIDLQQKSYREANQTFNTAFFSITALLIILLPLIFLITNNIEYLFNIESHLLNQARELFLWVLLSSIVVLFSGLFFIPAYANNRLDVINLSRFFIEVGKASLIVIFIVYISSEIQYIGYANIIITVIVLFYSFFVWKRFAPKLRIHFRFFNLNKLKEIASMGSWLLVNQLGVIFFLYIDLILINIYFGAVQTGEYSTILQWSTMLRSLAGVIASVLGPIIIIHFTKKETDKIIQKSELSIKLMGLALAIPIGILCGFAEPLLQLWLGKEFIHLAPLMWLMLMPLTVTLAVQPLFVIQLAYNKVKIPGLFTLASGLANLLIALILIHSLDIGYYSVTIAGIIAFLIKNIIFTPIYSAYLLNVNKFLFIKKVFPGFILSVIIFLFSFIVQQYFVIDTWLDLIISCTIILCVFSGLIWLVFTEEEKKLLINLLPVNSRNRL